MHANPKVSTVSRRVFLVIVVVGLNALCVQDSRTAEKGFSLSGIIEIEKNQSGRAIGVLVDDKASFPPELVSLLPGRETRKLTKPEIKSLVEKHGLFKEWAVNPVLQFQDGDVSYWYEQELSAWKMELELLARRIVIEQAEVAKATIPSQGDLSALSHRVFSWLHKKWRSQNPSNSQK